MQKFMYFMHFIILLIYQFIYRQRQYINRYPLRTVADSMTMISETSFVSSSSNQTALHAPTLLKIQSQVFNRVVNLKNQKIKMLSTLSDCIDRRYQAQSQLLHHLEIKRRKQQNLATRQQYEPIIYRNIQLKAEAVQLQRQALQRTTLSERIQDNFDLGDKSRAKSVLNLSRSKDLFKSSHSRTKNIIHNFKTQQDQIVEKKSKKDLEDKLIDQIIQQKKVNSSLEQIVRQQKNARLEKPGQYEIKQISKKLQALKRILETRESQSNSMKPSIKNNQRKSQQITPVTYSGQNIGEVSLSELYKYIQQQNEEKRLLYNELVEFQKQMEEMRDENDKMKEELARQTMTG